MTEGVVRERRQRRERSDKSKWLSDTKKKEAAAIVNKAAEEGTTVEQAVAEATSGMSYPRRRSICQETAAYMAMLDKYTSDDFAADSANAETDAPPADVELKKKKKKKKPVVEEESAPVQVDDNAEVVKKKKKKKKVGESPTASPENGEEKKVKTKIVTVINSDGEEVQIVKKLKKKKKPVEGEGAENPDAVEKKKKKKKRPSESTTPTQQGDGSFDYRRQLTDLLTSVVNEDVPTKVEKKPAEPEFVPQHVLAARLAAEQEVESESSEEPSEAGSADEFDSDDDEYDGSSKRNLYRSKWIMDRSHACLKMDGFTQMWDYLANSKHDTSDLMVFPTWPNGRPKMLRANIMKRLLEPPETRSDLTIMPAGDISVLQGDVNHLNLHQALYLRMQERNFNSKSISHAPHMGLLEKLEKQIIKIMVKAAYDIKKRPALPKDQASVAEGILMIFGACYEMEFEADPDGREVSPWWAAIVGDGVVMYANVQTLKITFKHPGRRINVYRDYSKATGGQRLFTIQVIELPRTIGAEDVLALLEADQNTSGKLMDDLANSKLFQKQTNSCLDLSAKEKSDDDSQLSRVEEEGDSEVEDSD